MEKEPKIEQSKIEEKAKRPQYEIELEQRPMPQDEEDSIQWIGRIGGPNVNIMGNLDKYSRPKCKKEDRPMEIDLNGSMILNDKNILKYFGEKGKKKVDDAKLFNEKKKEYQIGKELWGSPDDYRRTIINLLKENHKILVDYRFKESVNKWVEDIEKEKAPPAFEEEFGEEDFAEFEASTPVEGGEPKSESFGEEPKEEPEAVVPEASEPHPDLSGREKKPLTLDEKIKQKEKELEETEQNYNIYYSPAVKSLFGLYYKSEFKSLKKEVKKLKKARKKKGEVPTDVGTGAGKEVEEQFKEIEKELRKVSKGIREGGVLGQAELEKKQTRLEKIKKKIKERLKIEKRLKEIPKEIKKSGVLEQTKLEGEKKKLEKRLKKFK